jgi:hypothetical protein
MRNAARTPSFQERACGYALILYWPFAFAIVVPLWFVRPPRMPWPTPDDMFVMLLITFVAGIVMQGAQAPAARAVAWGIVATTVGLCVWLFLHVASQPSPGIHQLPAHTRRAVGLAMAMSAIAALAGHYLGRLVGCVRRRFPPPGTAG